MILCPTIVLHPRRKDLIAVTCSEEKQIFILWCFTYFYLAQTKREKRSLASIIKKTEILFPLETSRTSKGLSSHSKFFRVGSSRGGKERLAFVK